jgi:hypothetical protein
MKRGFLSIFLVFFCVFSVPVMAQLSTSGLTEEQVADMAALIAAKKAENVKKGGTEIVEAAKDPERMKRYAEVGEAIAKSLGAAAKEMGVAVNDFMSTPAGTLTVLLIVYHFIGSDLIALFVAGSLIPVVVYMWFRAVRYIRTDRIERNEAGKKVAVHYERFSENQGWSLFGVTIAFVVLTLLLLLTALPT